MRHARHRWRAQRGTHPPAGRRALLPAIGLICAAAALSPAAAAAEACPNERLRQENNSLGLPDCRAYEMVSPLEKSDSGVLGIDKSSEGGVVQTAADGNSITYVSLGSFRNPQGAPLGSQYLSMRDSEEWSTQNIAAPEISDTYANAGYGTPYEAFSSDLTRSLMINGLGYRPVENPPLAPGAPPGYQNFYLYEKNNGPQALLTSTPGESPETFVMELAGATPDLEHIVIATDAALTTGMLDTGGLNRNLYEWANGRFQPINVLHDGTPVPGAQVGSTPFESHSVSADGSRVFWSILPGGSQEPSLYVRENGDETVEVDASQGPDEGGEGIFRTASSDGSKAFFTDRRRLTKDSTAHKETAEGEDLYEFDVNSGQLSDLTVDENVSDLNGASVQGVLGASEDGFLVYFVAKGVLAGANDEGHLPVSGGLNLYVHDGEGRTTFIATLSPDDERQVSEEEEEVGVVSAHDWSNSVAARTTRVTPDGRHLVFMSDASLTGYDNIDAITGKPDQEVYSYVYDGAGAGRLSCVSCNPGGARPVGASRIPGGTDFGSGGVGEAVYQSRVLSEDGSRVFFDSRDELVPTDTNGEQDVYEYENGWPYLISGGTSGEESSFVDASATGNDVFFITSQALVPGDTDTLVDLYDARVDGGLPPPSTPASPCGGEGCLPPVSAQPVFGPSASATFAGVGNLSAPPAKPAVKPREKHKRKPKPHKRKSRNGKATRTAKGRKR